MKRNPNQPKTHTNPAQNSASSPARPALSSGPKPQPKIQPRAPLLLSPARPVQAVRPSTPLGPTQLTHPAALLPSPVRSVLPLPGAGPSRAWPNSPPPSALAQPALRVASPPARLPLPLSANFAAQCLSAVRSPPPSDKAVPPGSRLSLARSRVASPDPAFPSLTVWAGLPARHLPPPAFPAALSRLCSAPLMP